MQPHVYVEHTDYSTDLIIKYYCIHIASMSMSAATTGFQWEAANFCQKESIDITTVQLQYIYIACSLSLTKG